MPKMDVANLHDTHPIMWMTPEPEAGFDRDQNRAFRHPHSKFREPPSAVGPSLRALPPRTAAVVLGILSLARIWRTRHAATEPALQWNHQSKETWASGAILR
jgi:hypothetical protein